jgi:V/A-type H+-transporting ATPase subunit C
MYGRRLIKKDYLDLLNCKSVGEIASILKCKSDYFQILQELNESNVHRGQLEALIKKKIFYDTGAICRYELSTGEQFSGYIIMRMEIEQILHTLRLLSAGKSPRYIYSMPLFFNKHTKINLPALIKVENFKDFLEALSGSRYRKILAPFEPRAGENILFSKIEVMLYFQLYNTIFDVIKKYTKGEAQKELYEIFNSYVDFYNFVRIVRLKKYYNTPPEDLYPLLLPFGTLRQKQIQDMVQAESYDKAIEMMKKTNAGRKIANIEFRYVDELPLRVNYLKCNRLIRFSVYPSVVMFSYIALCEIELSNITSIIEGIRYKVPSEEIFKILVW